MQHQKNTASTISRLLIETRHEMCKWSIFGYFRKFIFRFIRVPGSFALNSGAIVVKSSRLRPFERIEP
jgi:hypothetical protein